MRKILVVEDTVDLGRMLVSFLSDHGYEPFYCEDGAAGWERLRREKADAVITDVNMPRMGGFELCRRIRADPRLRNMPILMLTVNRRVPQQVAGYKSGADDYLCKPFDFAELLARLQALERRILDAGPRPGRGRAKALHSPGISR